MSGFSLKKVACLASRFLPEKLRVWLLGAKKVACLAYRRLLGQKKLRVWLLAQKKLRVWLLARGFSPDDVHAALGTHFDPKKLVVAVAGNFASANGN